LALSQAQHIKRRLGKIKMGHGIILDGIVATVYFTIALFNQKTFNNQHPIMVIKGY